MSEMIRVLFFGTPNFAIPSLAALLGDGYDVIGVFTQPDKLTGRGKILTPPPIKVLADENGIPVFQPEKLDDGTHFIPFRSLRPDICVVAAYGKLIPQKYLDVPKYGFVNIHPSLLPKYRGPSPIQTALMNGDEETGVSIMLVDEKMDHGSIIQNLKIKIQNSEYHRDLEIRLAELGAKLLVETLPKYIEGQIKPVKQDDSKATYTKLLKREDGRIHWLKMPPEKIYNLIRALSDEPGTWTTWHNKILNIKGAHLKDGQLVLERVQLEGKKETPFKEFLHGHPDFKMSDLN